MTDYVNRRSINIEKSLAKLYLFFLPFTMFAPLSFLNSIVVGLGRRASFVFLALGLITILIKGRKIVFSRDESNSLLFHFAIMYIFCDFSSLVMATVLYTELGTIGGENTYNAVFPKILFSFAYIIILFYNRELFRVLSRKEVESVLDRVINVCIVVGLWQIGIIYFGSVFSSVFDTANLLFGSWSSSQIVRTGRIALFNNEPSTVAGFIGMLAIPYILSKFLGDKFRIVDTIKLALLIVILYYTKSTTGYTLGLLDLAVFAYLIVGRNRANIGTRLLQALFLVIVVAVLFYTVLGNDLVNDTVTAVFDKLLNSDNTSGMNRKAGLYVNWGIIKEYPLFGVGNGNQGFFYQKYFPRFMLSSDMVAQRYYESSSVLYDGGVFFASFASGYGIVGIILLLLFAVKSAQIMKHNRDIYGYLYYFYIIASISLIVTGFSSTLAADYTTWFVVSLPLACLYWKKKYDSCDEIDYVEL